MFNLIFGLFWTTFSTFCFIPLFMEGSWNLLIFLVVLLFEGIGLWMIFTGAKTIIINKRTDINGVNTYGIILGFSETGSYVNDVPELKAEVLTYLQSEGTTKVFTEIVGLAPAKYDIGAYLLLNQYENDINIIQETDKKFIPNQILEELNSRFEKTSPQTVDIGGVQYVRQDSIYTINKTDI